MSAPSGLAFSTDHNCHPPPVIELKQSFQSGLDMLCFACPSSINLQAIAVHGVPFPTTVPHKWSSLL